MNLGILAYLYRGSTVVINKEDIVGANSEDFQEVSLYLPLEFLKQSVADIEQGEENS